MQKLLQKFNFKEVLKKFLFAFRNIKTVQFEWSSEMEVSLKYLVKNKFWCLSG